jgi:sugar-specific transcriptional regulator TrmB
LTQDWLFNTLIDLGFKQSEAIIYVFLTLNGPQKTKDLALIAKMDKSRVYAVLKKLQKEGIVEIKQKRPFQFLAIPFERLLDLKIQVNLNEAKNIEDKKSDILKQWRKSVSNR